MNIIIAIANIQLFPETKNKKQEKNVLIHLKSCKLIFLLPNFPKHNYQNIACDFLAKIFFLSEKSSIFADSNKVDTPSLLHRYSIASPSFRWSIDGLLMDYRWSIYGVITYYLTWVRVYCTSLPTSTFSLISLATIENKDSQQKKA